MSRPIAADGTMRYSTPSAFAGASAVVATVHSPAANTTDSTTARIRLNARLILNLSRCRIPSHPGFARCAPAHVTRVVVNHIPCRGVAANA
ncbi:hypothetical protein MMAGJ_28340 [Mycolicibacterium mageritense]|uniref:Uncharacterized protein n=1 Tax=Mycolicibacterium mageritense TaxID=53462 RepID=A0ABM7HSL1_MYCME|nr:hypothetical protein MMAGJ_28340 [Mycolicibacterium mageritense]